MASIERTAYPRFKRLPTVQNLPARSTPSEEETSRTQQAARPPRHQLSLLILLKSFQRLGYFPKLDEVPLDIVQHIRKSLTLNEQIIPGYEEPRTLYRHHQTIREYLRVTPWNQNARRLVRKNVSAAAETMDNPADLINVALETLIKERFELSAFSTLDRLVRRVRAVINQRYFQTIHTRLNDAERQRLEAMLTVDNRTAFSDYQRLKQLPKSPK